MLNSDLIADRPYALVVYGSGEGHGTGVKEHLQARRLPVLFLDYVNPPPVAVTFDGQGGWSLSVEERVLPPPAAVFMRLKMLPPPKVSNEEEAVERLHVSEWGSFLRGLIHLLGDRVLNSAADRHSKILQHQLAARAGFDVPASQFFIGKQHGLSFIDAHEAAVMKAIGYPNTAYFGPIASRPGDALMTMALEREMVETAEPERFTAAPLWFQQRIMTGREIRIVVIGDVIFAGREQIDIEKRPHVDGRWRIEPHEPFEPSDDLQRKLLQYMRLSGLDYGVFDLIEQGDRCHFLECNPDGQWHSAYEQREAVYEALGDLLMARLQARTLVDNPVCEPVG